MALPQVNVVRDDIEPVEPRPRLADDAARAHALELPLLDHPVCFERDGAIRTHRIVAEEMMLDVAPRLGDCGRCSCGHETSPTRPPYRRRLLCRIFGGRPRIP